MRMNRSKRVIQAGKWLAAVCLIVAVSTGCSTNDTSRVLIEPSYSYVQAGQLLTLLYTAERADARR